MLGLVWALVVLAGGGVAAATDGGDEDRGRPWIDEMVADAIEDEDVAIPAEVAECYAVAVVEAVGVDQLEDEEITPRQLARASTLADLDIELDDEALDQLKGEYEGCGVGALLAEATSEGMTESLEREAEAAGIELEIADEQRQCLEDAFAANEHVVDSAFAFYVTGETAGDGGNPMEAAALDAVAECPGMFASVVFAAMSSMGMEVGPDARACVESHLADDGGALRATFATAMASGDGIAAGGQWFASVVTICPQVMIDGMVSQLEQAGVPPGPGGRACIAAEIAARPDDLAAAVADVSGATGEQFGMEIGAACVPHFDG